jgi:hypothetical protein
MKFRNRSPFPALAYSMVDVADDEHHVVVMRITYRLQRSASESTRSTDVFVAEAVTSEPPPLMMEDIYSGETGLSSVLQESDLAPFKPRCDVIVNANAHAPGAVASRRWTIRIQLHSRMLADYQQKRLGRPANGPAELLDKTLNVCGPRSIRHGLLGWSLDEPRLATEVAVAYEHAFGGTCRVDNPRHADDSDAPETLLNEACYSNPIGCGWIDERYIGALRRARHPVPSTMPGPQIEYPDLPIRTPALLRQPTGPHTSEQMAKLAAAYPERTAGLGCVGRAWTPRIQHAGSYNATWLAERWPHLPKDFQFDYWNGAPADQQIAFPPPDTAFVLQHLCSPEHAPTGQIRFALPGHRVYAMVRPARARALPLPFRIDTLIVDARAMTLSVLWRFSLPKAMRVAAIDACFEADPTAPLPIPPSPAAAPTAA